jgi:hypothetical protein
MSIEMFEGKKGSEDFEKKLSKVIKDKKEAEKISKLLENVMMRDRESLDRITRDILDSDLKRYGDKLCTLSSAIANEMLVRLVILRKLDIAFHRDATVDVIMPELINTSKKIADAEKNEFQKILDAFQKKTIDDTNYIG